MFQGICIECVCFKECVRDGAEFEVVYVMQDKGGEYRVPKLQHGFTLSKSVHLPNTLFSPTSICSLL